VTAACDACLARTWLVAELSGHLDPVRSDIDAVLALEDEDLVAAVAMKAAPKQQGAVA
jgi:hypothetical protein